MKSRYGCWERLKEARKKIGISQKDLAEVLQISPAYLSLMETGRQVLSEPVAYKIQELYHIDANWLLFGDPPRKESSSRLKQARSAIGLTQGKLAGELGVSAQYLGLMERGESPVSKPVASSLQELYGISADWLLFGRGDMRITDR